MSRSDEWLVNIPFSDLKRLIDHLDTQDKSAVDMQQLRRELDGLRDMFRELMDQFGELRRIQRG